MRSFIKALSVIFLIAAAALCFVRYAPLPFLDQVRAEPILSDTVFPEMDHFISLTKQYSRDGVGSVAFLKEQAWLTELLAEDGPKGKQDGRKPASANDGTQKLRANRNAGAEIKGTVAEIVGDDFQVLGQSQMDTTGIAGTDFVIQGKFSVFLAQDTEAYLWNLKSRGSLYSVLEVRTGMVEVKVAPVAVNVFILLRYGTYKALKPGDKYIAGVINRDGVLIDAIKPGLRNDFSSLALSLRQGPKTPVSGTKEKAQKKPASASDLDGGLE
jgi:hypothetical protein